MKHLLLWLSGLLLISNLFAAPSLPASVFFVPNLGQWDGAFLFYYENGTLSGYVTTDGLTLDLHEPLKPQPRPENAPPLNPPRKRGGNKAEDAPIIRKGHVLMLDIVGGKQENIEGTELLASYSNYFLSRDSCRWRGHVPNYQSLIARTVWPGIDIEYRATLNGIETVFHVQLGADPSVIQMRYRGTDAPLSVDANGSLQLVTSMGTIFEQAPFAFQIIDHRQQSVPVAYHLLEDNTYNLTLSSYDRSRELVIDPLVYSTNFPGNINDVCLDLDANIVVTGGTYIDNFPTTPGAYEDSSIMPWMEQQSFISKLDPDAQSFLYSTYFSGSRGDHESIAVDGQNRIIFGCAASFRRWPLTEGAYDTISEGEDLGFAMLSVDGASLLYATFLGGSGQEIISQLAVDSAGMIYILSTTYSLDLPVTSNAWFPSSSGGAPFMAIFDPQTHSFRECTYLTDNTCLSGWLYAGYMTIASPGRVWITAWCDGCGAMPTTPDAFSPTFPAGIDGVSYFGLYDMNTHSLEYGSYWGISGLSSLRSLIPSDSNRIWLAGTCHPNDFTMPPGGYQETPRGGNGVQGFIAQLQLPNIVRKGTYLSGSNWFFDWSMALAIEQGGTVLAAGMTASPDFPVTPDAFSQVCRCTYDPSNNPNWDAFLVRLSPNLDSLLYGTFLGADSLDEIVYNSGLLVTSPDRIWLVGTTNSWNHFPVTPDAMFPLLPPEYLSLFRYSFLSRFSLPLPDTTDVTSPFILQPSSFSLACYPNPFNPSTKISFTIPKSGAVSLRVYDVLGREVAALLDQRMNAGEHSVMFDADGLASGVYFARLECSGMQRVQKMVVMR